jgi:hypothetical protein
MENSTEVKNVNPDQPNPNLIPCKHCGAQMAKSAKKCPSCGGKNKAKSQKKLIVFGVVVLIIAIIFGSNSIVNKIKENNIEFEQGFAATMLNDHRTNEAAANEKYSGKAYYFVGIVSGISSTELDVCVDGNVVVNGALRSIGGHKLTCDLSELKNTEHFYENVKEGSTVTVKGVIDDIWNGHINIDAYYIELYEGEYEYTYLNVK